MSSFPVPELTMGRLKGEILKPYPELPVFLPVARFEAAQHDAGRRVYLGYMVPRAVGNVLPTIRESVIVLLTH
ncbi:hypothetical protein [Embleya sp. NPDC050493]|uniref:hypothetical protein n=1 Tax=Embleya sp. NPDC050493 TaxID=3363989 RepID=UPI0037BDE6C3